VADVGFVFLGLLIVTLAGVAWYWNARFVRARREGLVALARSMGWHFDPNEHDPWAPGFSPFDRFRKGSDRATYNTIEGDDQIGGRKFHVLMGDYTYTTESSDGKRTSRTTHRFSYALIQPPFQNLPDLLIRREGLVDKIAGALGFSDFNFESEEFNRRFHVTGDDKKFAYGLICPPMMEFLLASNPPPVELRGGWVCLVRYEGCWTPEEFRANLEWARQFFGLWPEYLTQELAPRA
jgi:hypothetical protein